MTDLVIHLLLVLGTAAANMQSPEAAEMAIPVLCEKTDWQVSDVQPADGYDCGIIKFDSQEEFCRSCRKKLSKHRKVYYRSSVLGAALPSMPWYYLERD